MPMMENRIPILLALCMLVFFINFAEMIFENSFDTEQDIFTDEIKGNDTTKTGYEKGLPWVKDDMLGGGETNTGTSGTYYGLFTPIVEFFVVDFEGMPNMLIFLLSTINIIIIGLLAYMIATIILDALPFTGG